MRIAATIRAFMARPAVLSPVLQRLARGGFWTLFGEAGARGLALAAAVVAARWLGPGQYGAFILVQGTLTMLMAFAGLSLGHTATRYIAAHRDAAPDRVATIHGTAVRLALASGGVASVLLYAGAPMLARDVLNAPELIGYFRLVSPLMTVYAVCGALIGTIQGFEEFEGLAKVSWLSGVASFAGIVGGTIAAGLTGAFIGLLSAELLRGGAIFFLAKRILAGRRISILGRGSAGEIHMIWHFSLPVLISAAMNTPVMWLCQSLIAREPNGLTEIAHYDTAQKWMTLVVLVPMAASSAIAPLLAHLSATEPERFRNTALGLAVSQSALTLLPAACVAWWAPRAMGIFGESFADATPTLLIAMAMAPILVLKHHTWLVLTSFGSAWAGLWQHGFSAAVALLSAWHFKSSGSAGLANAMLISNFAALVIGCLLLQFRSTEKPASFLWGRPND